MKPFTLLALIGLFLSACLAPVQPQGVADRGVQKGVQQLAGGVQVACGGVQLGNQLAIECDLTTPTPEATRVIPEDLPTATETEVPLPTSTPTITPVPLPTVTPTALARVDYPLCAEHDVTKWHALEDPERHCHYDHFHGDDPNSDLALTWFDPISATISYPWQTFKVQASGAISYENEFKHSGYIWLVRQLARQNTDNTWYEINNDLNWVGRTPNVVVAVRMQFHRHPTLDALVQKHSYWIQTYECALVAGAIDFTKCGTSSSGGVAHFGVMHCAYKEIYCQLSTDEAVPANQWLPGLGMDISGKIIDPYRATNKPCRTADKVGVLDRLANLPDGWIKSGVLFEDNNRDNWSPWFSGPGVYGKDSTGKGFNWLMGFGILNTDDADCNDLDSYRAAQSLQDATAVLQKRICDSAPVGSACRFNGSEHAVFTVYSLTPPEWDGRSGLDTDPAKGFVSLTGFTDLRGNLSPLCTAASAVCVPIRKVHSPVGWSGWNTAVGRWRNGKAPGNLQDYDTSPVAKQWIVLEGHGH